MEAGQGAAGDGDEDKGEDLARDDRATAGDVLGDRLHGQGRMDHGDAQGQHDDGADLQVGGEVVTRAEQQPYRQHRGDKTVGGDEQGDLLLAEGEHRRQGRVGRDVRSGGDGEEEQPHADHAGPLHVAGPDLVQVQPHDEGDGEGADHGVGAPRAGEHGVDHGDGEAGQGQDQDEQDGKGGHRAGRLADLVLGDARQALAPVPDRGEEHDGVVDRTGQHAADDDPERAGEVAELGGQHRPQKRSGGSDGGKVVAEQDELVGLHVVDAVGHLHGRRLPILTDGKHLAGNEQPVVPVGQGEDTQSDKHQGQCVHLFLLERNQPAAVGCHGSRAMLPYREGVLSEYVPFTGEIVHLVMLYTKYNNEILKMTGNCFVA